MGRIANKAKDETRKDIMKVAQELFARQGYSGARIQTIADKVGIQKASIYYHFNGKKDLYRAIMFDILRKLDERVTKVLQKKSDRVERYISLQDTLVDFFGANPNYARLLLRNITGEDRIVDEGLREIGEKTIRLVAEFFAEGIR